MNTHGNVAFNAQTYRDWIGPDARRRGARRSRRCSTSPGCRPPGGGDAHADAADARLPLRRRRDAAARRAPRRDLHDRGDHGLHRAAARTEGGALPALRKAYSGGAPIAPAVVEAFERRFGAYIHNIYGLTETTSPSHAVPFARARAGRPGTGALSVGVPVFDTTSRIVDEAGERGRRSGELGEIVTAGPQVVPGLLGRRTRAFEDDAAHRRRRLHGRRRLVLRRRPQEGPDQRLRLQGLAARGRGRPLRAPGGAPRSRSSACPTTTAARR